MSDKEDIWNTLRGLRLRIEVLEKSNGNLLNHRHDCPVSTTQSSTPLYNSGTLTIVCSGGCGKTTENVNPHEFWAGRVVQTADPDCRVPDWTCKECVAKGK